MDHSPLTFANFLPTAENRSALLAVQEVADCLTAEKGQRRGMYAGRPTNTMSPLFLFGPAGTGKTHLVSALAEQVQRQRPELVLANLSAGDFTISAQQAFDSEESEDGQSRIFELAGQSDLLIVEDVHQLHANAMLPFVQLIDHLQSNGQPMVFTANAGPQHWRRGKERFPARLVSRLTCGTVVKLDPLQLPSRLALLKEKSNHLNLDENMLLWLAQRLTGGARQLLGAVGQLEMLTRLHCPLQMPTVASHFEVQNEASRINVENITRKVGAFFQVEPKQLRSRRRYRDIMMPRQVSMYLARHCTDLSLEQIGAYFGGRDHTTVIHACRKVEAALEEDGTLSGAIQQLQVELL